MPASSSMACAAFAAITANLSCRRIYSLSTPAAAAAAAAAIAAAAMAAAATTSTAAIATAEAAAAAATLTAAAAALAAAKETAAAIAAATLAAAAAATEEPDETLRRCFKPPNEGHPYRPVQLQLNIEGDAAEVSGLRAAIATCMPLGDQ
ncbi:hypothetical protein Emag_000675 [Eimeria magna]